MDLLRQVYVLPHWGRCCRSNVLPHPVTVYWHRADQSQCWPYNARRLAGQPLECQFLSHWYDSTPTKFRRKQDSNLGSSTLEADALPRGQRGGSCLERAIRSRDFKISMPAVVLSGVTGSVQALAGPVSAYCNRVTGNLICDLVWQGVNLSQQIRPMRSTCALLGRSSTNQPTHPSPRSRQATAG